MNNCQEVNDKHEYLNRKTSLKTFLKEVLARPNNRSNANLSLEFHDRSSLPNTQQKNLSAQKTSKSSMRSKTSLKKEKYYMQIK